MLSDSLDLENSDDFNKIINKYENMLGGSKDANKENISSSQNHGKAQS
jgi:hypothetical protein